MLIVVIYLILFTLSMLAVAKITRRIAPLIRSFFLDTWQILSLGLPGFLSVHLAFFLAAAATTAGLFTFRDAVTKVFAICVFFISI